MANVESGYKGCWWTLLFGMAVLLMAGLRECYGPESETRVIHDTVWRDTTIYKPFAAETVKTGRVVYIRIPTQGGQSPCADDSLSHTGDSPHVSPDSIDVPIPIIQKRYDDSLYTAWVSGYEPNLDSIRLYHPEIYITKTIVKPAPRLSVGIQGGAGVGVFSRQPDVYVGVGIQWRLWPK